MTDLDKVKRMIAEDTKFDNSYQTRASLVPIGDNIGFNSGELIDEADDPDGKILRVGDFLAPPRGIGIAGARDNVGKTGLGLKLTSLLVKHGIFCLYLIGDQLREALNPYLNRFNIGNDRFYLHSFRRFGISLSQLKQVLVNYRDNLGSYPQFIIIDSGSDFEVDAQQSFMPFNKTGSQERFNYNEMSHILYCYRNLLYPLAEGAYTDGQPVSVFQFKHIPKNSYDLPHSYKEPAMTEVAWLLYNQNVDFKHAPRDQKIGLGKLCSFSRRTWGIYGRRTRFGDNKFFFLNLAKPVKDDAYKLRRGYYVCDYENLRIDEESSGFNCPALKENDEPLLNLDSFIERLKRKKGRDAMPEGYIRNQVFRGIDHSLITDLLKNGVSNGRLLSETYGDKELKLRYWLNEDEFLQNQLDT